MFVESILATAIASSMPMEDGRMMMGRHGSGSGQVMDQRHGSGGQMAGMKNRLAEFVNEGLSDADKAKVKAIFDAHMADMAPFGQRMSEIAKISDATEKAAALAKLKTEMEAKHAEFIAKIKAFVSADRLAEFEKLVSEMPRPNEGPFRNGRMGRDRMTGSGAEDSDGNDKGNRGRGGKSDRPTASVDAKFYDKVSELLKKKTEAMTNSEATSYLTGISGKIDALLSNGTAMKDSLRKKLGIVKDAVNDRIDELSLDLDGLLK